MRDSRSTRPTRDRTVIAEIRTVTEAQAYVTMQQLAAAEGINAGISSGAALQVALQIAAGSCRASASS